MSGRVKVHQNAATVMTRQGRPGAGCEPPQEGGQAEHAEADRQRLGEDHEVEVADLVQQRQEQHAGRTQKPGGRMAQHAPQCPGQTGPGDGAERPLSGRAPPVVGEGRVEQRHPPQPRGVTGERHERAAIEGGVAPDGVGERVVRGEDHAAGQHDHAGRQIGREQPEQADPGGFAPPAGAHGRAHGGGEMALKLVASVDRADLVEPLGHLEAGQPSLAGQRGVAAEPGRPRCPAGTRSATMSRRRAVSP